MQNIIFKIFLSFFLVLNSSLGWCQENTFHYELDLTEENDAFNITLLPPPLTKNDSVYSFVSYAPGVHQPLNFGRFVKSFHVFDKEGNELTTNKIALNDFLILEPSRVSKIEYTIDDSFDMRIDHHPIFPMSGTGITENYVLVNTFGVFGYFENLKDNPIELALKVPGKPKVGTALNKNENGVYEVDSYYHLADSPILIGNNLSYAYKIIDGIKVEAFVYSPNEKLFSAASILELATPILQSAVSYIGFNPVPRYTFLMYFADEEDKLNMPIFKYAGALEHSLSSTYSLPAKASMIPHLRNNIAHEFMHILSPLHLHSNVLANTDFSKPSSEDLHVWLYEGVTEWVSYKMQVSTGLVEFEDYLEYLSEKISNSQQYNPNYSLTQISKEWSTVEGNKQYNNIYQLGALTAAMLDIKLITLSNGKRGLREVYLDLIKKYGKDRPFDNSTFFDQLVAMTYPEIRLFINNHIKNNTPFNFKKEFESVGLRFIPKKIITNVSTTGLNLKLLSKNKAQVTAITDDYKGDQIEAGDIITHIDGKEINADSFKEVLKNLEEMEVGELYSLTVLRDNRVMQITENLYVKYAYNLIERNPSATKDQLRLMQKLR